MILMMNYFMCLNMNMKKRCLSSEVSDVGWSVRAVPDSSLLLGSVSPAVSVRGERGEGAVTATGNIQSHLISE